jgi:hypothetical protein
MDYVVIKLKSELDQVHTNLDVLELMLQVLQPGFEHEDDWCFLMVCSNWSGWIQSFDYYLGTLVNMQ